MKKYLRSHYDPLNFINQIELITIALIGSFFTWKLLNSLYDNVYEPSIDILIESGETNNYFLKIGEYYIHIGTIIKEFIKWFIVIMLLMFLHNMFKKIE